MVMVMVMMVTVRAMVMVMVMAVLTVMVMVMIMTVKAMGMVMVLVTVVVMVMVSVMSLNSQQQPELLLHISKDLNMKPTRGGPVSMARNLSQVKRSLDRNSHEGSQGLGGTQASRCRKVGQTCSDQANRHPVGARGTQTRGQRPKARGGWS